MRYSILVVSAIVLLMGSCCMNIEVTQTQTCPSERDKTIKVAVITGGHGFERESFLELFVGHKDGISQDYRRQILLERYGRKRRYP